MRKRFEAGFKAKVVLEESPALYIYRKRKKDCENTYEFYNRERFHQKLNYKTCWQMYSNAVEKEAVADGRKQASPSS